MKHKRGTRRQTFEKEEDKEINYKYSCQEWNLLKFL